MTRLVPAVLAAAALSLGPGAALAGKTAVSGIAGLPVFVPDFGTGDAAATLTTAAAVADALREAVAFCNSLPERAYAIDCLAERLAQIAAAMPATGSLAPARAELARAAQDLAALARSAPDPTLRPARARAPGGTRTTRPLVPIDRARAPEIAARAAAIVDRTETLLLRSPADPAGYRRIAAALDSSKVLLRSA